MGTQARSNIRFKLAILLVFACFLGAAFWQKQTFAEQKDTSVKNAPAAESAEPENTVPLTPAAAADDPKVEGCVKCHNNIEPMHRFNAKGDVFEKIDENGKDAQGLACTSCHGGNPVATTQKDAHVQPKFPKEWGCNNGECSSKNPERSNTLIAKESREFVRFVNPGDFRVIEQSCGQCHSNENKNVSSSMMSHGAVLWGAALYNNGGYPNRDA